MKIDSIDRLSPSIIQKIQFLEWIFIAAHAMMAIADGDNPLLIHLTIYSFFVIYGLQVPINRSSRLKECYILLGLVLIVLANFLDVSLELFLLSYIAKSFFMVGQRKTVYITIMAGISWIASEYFAEIKELEKLGAIRFEPPFGAGIYNPQKILISTLCLYVALSIITIVFCSLIASEQKNRKKAEKLAEQVETLTLELERNRIARDIHDSLGHTLNDLDMSLRIAREEIHDCNIEKSLQAIDQASIFSTQCKQDVSHVIKTMRKSNFDLNQAIIDLIGLNRERCNTRIQWKVDFPKLDLSTSHQIYCLVKEALINIQKHAQASLILFEGYLSDNQQILIKIEDDGIGFDRQKVSNLSFGLQGMSERIVEIKGEFEVNSAPGQGTQILIKIPFNRNSKTSKLSYVSKN